VAAAVSPWVSQSREPMPSRKITNREKFCREGAKERKKRERQKGNGAMKV